MKMNGLSEWYVAVFLRGIGHAFGGKLLQCADNAETGIAGFDYVVDIAVFRCIVGVAEKLVVFGLLLGKHLLGVVRCLGFLGVEYFYGACTAHYGDFRRRPCIVHVAAQLFAAHHDVRAAVALAECYRYLGHGGFAIGVKQFGAMQDYAVVLLTGAGKESGNIDERYQRNVEGIAETHEACGFARCVAVEHAGEEFGLVGHDADALAVEAGEAYDDVAGIVALDFKEFAVVDDCSDYLIHVVRAVGAVGDDFVERILHAVDGVVALHRRCILKVVLGNIAEEFADDLDGFLAASGR